MKKVLVVDDSALMRRAMSDIISQTNKYIVVYTASNGVEGLEFIRNQDDIIAVFCDINMPKMSGIELLSTVKQNHIDIPFIMISSSHEAKDTLIALELGCLDFIKKPENIFDCNNESYKRHIKNALMIAEEICERRSILKPEAAPTKPEVAPAKLERVRDTKSTIKGKNKLIALVCSTGGPKALQRIVPKLPKNLPVPMVLVQHMPAGFTLTLAQRLDTMSQITVKEAEDGERLKEGVCYISRGGLHLTVSAGKIRYDDAPPVVGLKPCGNIMYKSLVQSDYDEIICVVLTGMGADGTKGIKELAGKKNIYVIAQDESSSTVYGMPRAIYESGLTDCVCDLDEIANEIVKKVGV